MAVSIGASDVKAGYQTGIPDSEIDLLISVVDGANACLDANAVPADKQTLLKVYAVRHMLALMDNSGRGQATSESAASGASRSFAQWQGKGLLSTRYGTLLKQLDVYGCVTTILQQDVGLMVMSVGRGR
jgi:hypothetical protein